MNNKRLSALAFTAALGFSGAAGAGLIDRGNGLIYDTVLDITWLQDANYAKTSSYDADGLMNWDAAVAWADQLVYGGFDDWRLPIITDTGTSGCNWASSGTDCGYNVQTYDSSTGTVYSELAYMYYVNLGLKSYYNTSGVFQADWGIFGNGTSNGTNTSSLGQNNVGLIQNLQAYVYWSGTEDAPNTVNAWNFDAYDGSQDASGKDYDSTPGPCAPAMSPAAVLPSRNRAVLRWSG